MWRHSKERPFVFKNSNSVQRFRTTQRLYVLFAFQFKKSKLNRNVKERGKNRNEDINLEILIWKATIVQAQLRKSDKRIRLKRSDNLEFEKKKKRTYLHANIYRITETH